MAAIGADHPLLGEKSGFEEGKAADVVEMKMAQENVDLLGGSRAEFAAEGGQAGSRIEDEQALAAADLDAGCVRAELDELRTGCAGGAAYAPEPDLQRVRGCNTPYHFRIMANRKPCLCALAHINKLPPRTWPVKVNMLRTQRLQGSGAAIHHRLAPLEMDNSVEGRLIHGR